MGLPVSDPQPKVPVVRRAVYTLYFEQATPHHTFIHCDIHARWSPEIKRQLAADWTVLKDLHGGPIYAQHTPGDRLHAKFLTLFGFHHVVSFLDHEGTSREIHQT
jgi:hypothetical protein